MPQYMLLIYGDPADAPPADQQEAQYAEWLNLHERARGIRRDGQRRPARRAPQAAKTVRVRGGDTQLTDGPFAETKEILGGYYLVDVPTIEDAVALAAKMPNIETGSVEVRPVVVFPETG